jgi:hypothetical protein
MSNSLAKHSGNYSLVRRIKWLCQQAASPAGSASEWVPKETVGYTNRTQDFCSEVA